MNLAAWLHFLTWLNRELVNALLRPVWLRYCAGLEYSSDGSCTETARAKVCFLRFCRLVDAADCYPCRVDWERCGALIITAGRDAEVMAEYDDWGF